MSEEFLSRVQEGLRDLASAIAELNRLWDDAVAASELENAFKTGDEGAGPTVQPASDILDVVGAYEQGKAAQGYAEHLSELIEAYRTAAAASGESAKQAASAAKAAVARISAPTLQKVLPADVYQVAVDLFLQSAYAVQAYILSVEDPSEYGTRLPTLASLVERLLSILATVKPTGEEGGAA